MIYKATGKFTKPTKPAWYRIDANAEDVMRCKECRFLVDSRVFAGLVHVDIDCEKCGWKGTVRFWIGGGTA